MLNRGLPRRTSYETALGVTSSVIVGASAFTSSTSPPPPSASGSCLTDETAQEVPASSSSPGSVFMKALRGCSVRTLLGDGVVSRNEDVCRTEGGGSGVNGGWHISTVGNSFFVKMRTSCRVLGELASGFLRLGGYWFYGCGGRVNTV